MARHFSTKKLRKLMKNSPVPTVIAILILVILLLTVLVVLWNYRSAPKISNPEGTVGNTAGNLNNLGMFCEYNGLVYFSNTFDGGALYCMSPEEENIQFLSNSVVQTLLAGGDYLYYFQAGVAGSGDLSNIASTRSFNRANLNGKRSVMLSPDIVITGQLVNNYLYLLAVNKEGIQFYKLKVDKSEKLQLAQYAINPACVVDNTMYYNGTIDNHYLYALNTENDVPEVFLQTPMWNPIIQGDYLYYMDLNGNYRLCRYNLSTGEAQVLTNDRVDCYNVGGGWIYYQKNSKNTPQIKCIRTDGSDETVLAEGNYTHINMTSRYVYFQEYESGTMYHCPIGSSSCEVFREALQAIPAKK